MLMPSASLERGVRGQRRSDLLMGREGGESTSKCLCMNEGFVLALPRMNSKAIKIISFSFGGTGSFKLLRDHHTSGFGKQHQ